MNVAVKSAVRTLRILELFASSDRQLALRDVAAALALPKSSTHMLLATLMAEGYLETTPQGRYRMGTALGGEHGWVGGVTATILRAATPELDMLLTRFQESVVLGVPTPAHDVRIATSRQSPLAVRYEVSRDPLMPGWCTAMGQAMLAFRPEAEARAYLIGARRTALTEKTVTEVDAIMDKLRCWRALGHALNIDERFDGASGAAVPVRDPDGVPHAALNMVTLTPRFQRRREAIIGALTEAVQRIEARVFGSASDGCRDTALLVDADRDGG
ncbi:MAG: IclR family transcriptional regulator [Pseudomonadota bacterium]